MVLNNIFAASGVLIESSVAQWLCHSPCKPGVTGLIPGFSSLSDEILTEVPSHMTVVVCGTFNSKSTNHYIHCFIMDMERKKTNNADRYQTGKSFYQNFEYS